MSSCQVTSLASGGVAYFAQACDWCRSL